MAKKAPLKFDFKPASDEEALRHYRVIEAAIHKERPKGFLLDELESAVGMYMLARHFGWKVLYIIHSRKTIKKYEEVLDLKLSDHFEEFGPGADRTYAKKVIDAVSNFWKLVSGELKAPADIDKRAMTGG